MRCSRPEPGSHQPVLLKEVLNFLEARPGEVVVDATLGSGGHARAILDRLGPRGRLIGIDQDPEALARAQGNLRVFPQVDLIQANFTRLREILQKLNLSSVDAVLLDVGVSSEQLEEAKRGFSFLKEGPLDMRMNPEGPLKARDLVMDLSQRELEELFRKYGEERWARRIARRIVECREKRPIETTTDLVRVIDEAVPRRFHFGRLHPATRVFQALRICVNQELEALEAVLPAALEVLLPQGRLVAISFHSLEDRLVKQSFRRWAREEKVRLLTPKPVRPSREEIVANPRSRSAKLRAVEKKGT